MTRHASMVIFVWPGQLTNMSVPVWYMVCSLSAARQYSEIMTELIAEPAQPLLETRAGEGPVRQREMDILNAASMLNSIVITEGTKRNYLPALKDWKVCTMYDLYDVDVGSSCDDALKLGVHS